jgi:hypothetical protein
MIGELIARVPTAVNEYSEDADLKMMAAALDAASFAVTVAIKKFVRKWIRRASITD